MYAVKMSARCSKGNLLHRLALLACAHACTHRPRRHAAHMLCRSELLRGPLYYVVVLLIATLAAWRLSPVPMVALALMCGGDGLADIAGRNIGGPPLPHNPRKTWAGSIAMFLGEAPG